MKNKTFNLFVILLIGWMFYFFLCHRDVMFSTISYSLDIWFHSLLPAMFPFFVISDLLIAYHITYYIPKIIRKTFCFIFGVNEEVVTVFFLSCFSGFPSSARIVREMFDKGYLDLDDANRALMFTHFSNPMFVLSTVGLMFTSMEMYAYYVLISHYLGNVIIGVLSRSKKYHFQYDYTEKLVKSQSFSKLFIQAIRSSVDTCLLIAGTFTCFFLFSSFIIYYFNINGYPEIVLKGILEITMGIKSLSSYSIGNIYKGVLVTMFLSFGGLSVHMQVLSQIVGTKLSYHSFFVSRVFHALISGFICYLLFLLN